MVDVGRRGEIEREKRFPGHSVIGISIIKVERVLSKEEPP